MMVGVGYQRLLKVSPLAGIGEIFDEFRGGGEQRLEAVLNSAVGDGHRQMGLPSAGLAVQDQRPALGDEVYPEIGADQRFQSTTAFNQCLHDASIRRRLLRRRSSAYTAIRPSRFGVRQMMVPLPARVSLIGGICVIT